ncbi:hypothetical protein ACFQY5_09120 [Paeniroseomonas aquatica]|uniref:Uncharacterized protein n=1 Tax=Paeniroseomonas aquatica TaxID=373043 RepID=A0ABT8A149_9PROT|nr:hypothetical protein [Paeniroseomonas aquatica]MDN3563462.1 hypothetical protein [Paeniroseomonas aquatica]
MSQSTDKHPATTSDANVEAGVEQTFPASDPVSSTTSQGSRAVPPEEMMHPAGSKPAAQGDSVTISLPFPDQETAKLALETLVREGPVDRRSAEIVAEGSGACLHVVVPKADAERLKAKLESGPGTR